MARVLYAQPEDLVIVIGHDQDNTICAIERYTEAFSGLLWRKHGDLRLIRYGVSDAADENSALGGGMTTPKVLTSRSRPSSRGGVLPEMHPLTVRDTPEDTPLESRLLYIEAHRGSGT